MGHRKPFLIAKRIYFPNQLSEGHIGKIKLNCVLCLENDEPPLTFQNASPTLHSFDYPVIFPIVHKVMQLSVSIY